MELLTWKSEGWVGGSGGSGGHEIALKEQSSPLGTFEEPCLVGHAHLAGPGSERGDLRGFTGQGK